MAASSTIVGVITRGFLRECLRLRLPMLLATMVLLALSASVVSASDGLKSAGHAPTADAMGAGDGGIPQTPLHRDSPAKPRRIELACIGLDDTDTGLCVQPCTAALLQTAARPAPAPVRFAGHAADRRVPIAPTHRRQQGRAPPRA